MSAWQPLDTAPPNKWLQVRLEGVSRYGVARLEGMWDSWYWYDRNGVEVPDVVEWMEMERRLSLWQTQKRSIMCA